MEVAFPAADILFGRQNDREISYRMVGNHINHANLCKMKNGIVEGIKFSGNGDAVKKCEICCMGKQARQPFNNTGARSEEILGQVHSDVLECETRTIGGAKYLVSFIDDYTRKIFVY
ncbi:hypothetical protein QE152_g37927 [Popillia japonica]|uniref:Polyprotein n=1 Tax=Popillia japonica TaxID=7064 RepID=A0AAW1I8Q5_POPJA